MYISSSTQNSAFLGLIRWWPTGGCGLGIKIFMTDQELLIRGWLDFAFLLLSFSFFDGIGVFTIVAVLGDRIGKCCWKRCVFNCIL